MSVLAGAGAAALFGAAGYAGAFAARRICDTIVPPAGGPRPGRPAVAMLVVCACAAGLIAGLRGAGLPELVLAAVLCCALVGIWYSDVRSGVVPDVFTLIPLALVLGLACLSHQWGVPASAGIVFVPFAVAALASRGLGMGWGDVKLVALGGAVLGWEAAILAFGCACALAVIVALARKRRHEPLAFAPYLVAAIALPLTAGLPS
ncbi:MAG: leader peptidase (prepilin peptidase) / N-methyltransferase [Candidatus Eremiobacteraeota bacterium]|nr:leader peptidase (prepilin peptidase) / N-methyltransferase [Candidatus Eremiobacteraeota bacterium]